MKKVRKFLFVGLMVVLALSLIAATAYATRYAYIKAGQNLTVPLGNAGATFVKAYTSGTIQLQRKSLTGEEKKGAGFSVLANPLDVRFYDLDGVRYRTVIGAVYVYFTLNSSNAKLWDAGRVSIFFYDTWKGKWTPCSTYKVASKGDPRVGCRIRAYGMYALGSK